MRIPRLNRRQWGVLAGVAALIILVALAIRQPRQPRPATVPQLRPQVSEPVPTYQSTPPQTYYPALASRPASPVMLGAAAYLQPAPPAEGPTTTDMWIFAVLAGIVSLLIVALVVRAIRRRRAVAVVPVAPVIPAAPGAPAIPVVAPAVPGAGGPPVMVMPAPAAGAAPAPLFVQPSRRVGF